MLVGVSDNAVILEGNGGHESVLSENLPMNNEHVVIACRSLCVACARPAMPSYCVLLCIWCCMLLGANASKHGFCF